MQAPLQLLKLHPDAGAAPKVTDAPLAYENVHMVPQLICPSLLVTVPLPLVETVRA